MKWKSMVNMTCENHHGYGLVALQQQRQMSVVDDDQRPYDFVHLFFR